MKTRSTLIVPALAVALLAVVAAQAAASDLVRPAERRWRGESRGRGVEDVTILRVHGGFSMPTGDFGDVFDEGFAFGVDVAHGISRTVLLSAGVGYHNFDGDGFSGDATVVPITLNIDAVLPSGGSVHPWIGGGIGAYNVDVDLGTFVSPTFGLVTASASETNFGINFGAGFAAPAGRSGAWGMGLKFHHVFEGDTFDSLDFVSLQVGYGFFL